MAPDDLRLAPPVIEGAWRVSSSWIGAGVWPSVWGTSAAVLSVTGFACAWVDDTGGAVWAAIGALASLIYLAGVRRLPKSSRNAAASLEATLAATAQTG